MNQNPQHPGIPPHLQPPTPPTPPAPPPPQGPPPEGFDYRSPEGQQNPDPAQQPPVDERPENTPPKLETTRVVHKCCHVIDLGEAAEGYRKGQHSHIFCDVCLGKFPVTEFFWEGTTEQLFYAGA